MWATELKFKNSGDLVPLHENKHMFFSNLIPNSYIFLLRNVKFEDRGRV